MNIAGIPARTIAVLAALFAAYGVCADEPLSETYDGTAWIYGGGTIRFRYPLGWTQGEFLGPIVSNAPTLDQDELGAEEVMVSMYAFPLAAGLKNGWIAPTFEIGDKNPAELTALELLEAAAADIFLEDPRELDLGENKTSAGAFVQQFRQRNLMVVILPGDGSVIVSHIAGNIEAFEETIFAILATAEYGEPPPPVRRRRGPTVSIEE